MAALNVGQKTMSGKQPKRIPRPGIDEYGRSPLLNAVIVGDLSKIGNLLAAGATVDLQDDNGWTALHFAAQERREDIVRALLERGANPNLLNAHGNGPLWVAAMNARGEFGIVRALLAAGADPQKKNLHGRSPRDIAVAMGRGLETVIPA